MTRVVHLLLTLAVALGLGAGAAVLVDRRLDASVDREYAAAGDRVLAAVAGLRDDRVHVTDDARAILDETGEAAIAAALTERDLPVYVVVWEKSWFAGYDHYIQAAEQILHRLDEPGVLVLWQGPDTSTTQVSEGYRISLEVASDEPDYLGDPARRITEWIDQVPDAALEPADSDSDYYGGRVGGFFAGLLYGLPVVLAAWLLVGLLRVSTGRRFRNLPARP